MNYSQKVVQVINGIMRTPIITKSQSRIHAGNPVSKNNFLFNFVVARLKFRQIQLCVSLLGNSLVMLSGFHTE